jgi:hypothetical protein
MNQTAKIAEPIIERGFATSPVYRPLLLLVS